jgi:ketosteroid isomerase-like protein
VGSLGPQASHNEPQGRLAQLGERLPYKQEVTGSSPVPPIVDRPVQTQKTVIEQLFAAVSVGDADQVLEFVHPHVEWTPTVWSGDPMYRGREGVHLWLSQFGEDLRCLDIRVQRVKAQHDRGAVLGIVFDTRGERTFAVQVPWSFELEDELLRRGRAHGSWEEALRAVGLD